MDASLFCVLEIYGFVVSFDSFSLVYVLLLHLFLEEMKISKSAMPKTFFWF